MTHRFTTGPTRRPGFSFGVFFGCLLLFVLAGGSQALAQDEPLDALIDAYRAQRTEMVELLDQQLAAANQLYSPVESLAALEDFLTQLEHTQAALTADLSPNREFLARVQADIVTFGTGLMTLHIGLGDCDRAVGLGETASSALSDSRGSGHILLIDAPLTGALADARACASSSHEAISLNLAVETYTLDNGLRVVLSANTRTPTVAVAVYYDVGSRNEEVGRSGFAHLFEHMMFQGSANISKGEHFQYITDNGGRMNGTTSEDRTNYFEILPSDRLELGLWLEADRMRSLDISDTNFENQREVVKEERRLRVDNRPYVNGWIQFITQAYEGWPYGHSVIGSMADLDAAELADVQAFFDLHYAPNNAVLAVVGDFDIPTAQALIEAQFGDIPRGIQPPEVVFDEPVQTEMREVVYEDTIATQPMYVMSWHVPPAPHTDNDAVRLLAEILAGGESSVFYQRLVRGDEITIDVSAYVEGRRGPDLLVAEATMRGEDPSLARDAMLEEVANLTATGVSAEQLSRAQERLIRNQVFSLEGNLYIALRLGRDLLYYGDATRVNEAIARIEAVTADDVNRVLSTYLVPTNANIMLMRLGEAEPESEASAPIDDSETAPDGVEVDSEVAEVVEGDSDIDSEIGPAIAEVIVRQPAPSPGESRPYVLPGVRELFLDNGMQVTLVQRPGFPTMAVRLSIRAGRDASPENVALATLTGRTLRDGTAHLSADEISATIDGNGIGYSVSVDLSRVLIGADALSTKVDTVLDLLGQLMREPVFPAERVQSRAQEYRGELESEVAQPSFHRYRLTQRVLFGDHAYASAYPELEQIDAVDRDAVAAFYDLNYRPERAHIVLVGELPDDIEARVTAHFGSWTPTDNPWTSSPPGAIATCNAAYVVERPNSAQTSITWVGPGVDMDDPDYFSALSANQVLGGSASARLFMNLREDKSYTYGAYSRITQLAGISHFTAYSDVRSDVTSEALAEFELELARLAEEPLSEDELGRSLNYLSGVFPIYLETNQRLAGELSKLLDLGTGVAFLTNYRDNVQQVTAERASIFGAGLVSRDQLSLVMVGTPKLVVDAARPHASVVYVYGLDGELVGEVPGDLPSSCP